MNVERFSKLTLEQKCQAYAKIVDDRDVAMKVSEKTTIKLETLARHLFISDGCLIIKTKRLNSKELKILQGVVEVEQ